MFCLELRRLACRLELGLHSGYVLSLPRLMVGRPEALNSLQHIGRFSTGSSGWDAKAMINCGDSQNGASPLHLAAAVSHKEMVTTPDTLPCSCL